MGGTPRPCSFGPKINGLPAAAAGKVGKVGETSMGAEIPVGFLLDFVVASDFQSALFGQTNAVPSNGCCGRSNAQLFPSVLL